MLLETDFTGADLTQCHVYGVSAWGLKLENAKPSTQHPCACAERSPTSHCSSRLKQFGGLDIKGLGELSDDFQTRIKRALF